MKGQDRVFVSAAATLIGAYLILLPVLWLPQGDAGFPDLMIGLAPISLSVSATGSMEGALLLALALALVHIARPGNDAVRGIRECFVLAVALGLFLGGGAAFNGQILKPWIAAPRPNIEMLARFPSTESPVLRMSAEDFYGLGGRGVRQAHLNEVLNSPEMHAVLKLPSGLRAHWIRETNYSLPSTHAFTAMFVATFFLLLGSASAAGWRRVLSYCLPLWAVLVCYSRPLLWVHRPADVLIGGLLGIALASAAFVSAHAALRRLA